MGGKRNFFTVALIKDAECKDLKCVPTFTHPITKGPPVSPLHESYPSFPAQICLLSLISAFLMVSLQLDVTGISTRKSTGDDAPISWRMMLSFSN